MTGVHRLLAGRGVDVDVDVSRPPELLVCPLADRGHGDLEAVEDLDALAVDLVLLDLSGQGVLRCAVERRLAARAPSRLDGATLCVLLSGGGGDLRGAAPVASLGLAHDGSFRCGGAGRLVRSCDKYISTILCLCQYSFVLPLVNYH